MTWPKKDNAAIVFAQRFI